MATLSTAPSFVSCGALRCCRPPNCSGPVCVAASHAPPAVVARPRAPNVVRPAISEPLDNAIPRDDVPDRKLQDTINSKPMTPLEAARVLVHAGDYQEAIAAFAEAEKASEVEDSTLLRSWACIEGSRGDPKTARALFARAVKAANAPDLEAAAWNAWALMEQHSGNVGTARKCFANGLKVDPAHVPLLQAFAIFEGRFGSKDRARLHFAKAAEIGNGHRAWLAWATFENAEDNVGRARFLFKTAAEKAEVTDAGPGAALAYARFEESRRNMERAREIYHDLVSRYGQACGKILHAWGTAESRAGNYLRSRQLFRASLLSPDMAGPYAAPTFQAWALAEKKAGNTDGARALFKRGSVADPKHAHVWQAWGIFEQQCGETDRARSIFERGMQANPHSAPTLNAWARLEASEGNINKARELYRRATTSDPRHAQSWQAWAILEGRAGDLDAARALFRQTVERNPTCAPAWQAWACMEHGVGNVDAARSLFQHGVNADPNHIAVWQAWSDMEKKIGEWKQGPACSLSIA